MLKDGELFSIHRGDCILHMPEMPAASCDLQITSVPFPTLYAYTPLQGDIGNSEDLQGDARVHLSFYYRQLKRVIKPGRIAVVHVTQIVRMKRAGGDGVVDFRGLNIRLAERAGLVYLYDWSVRRNPQAQSIKTRSRSLSFAGMEADRAQIRGAMIDYLLIFKAPGENAVPINSKGEVSRNDWIQLAEGHWNDIRETDTLNTREAKSDSDTKHICAMQLGMIDRLVRLYSNPGEIVFDPFTGVGSTGYCALKRGRRFYGTELKEEYHAAAIRNCQRAINQHKQLSSGKAGAGRSGSILDACEAAGAGV